MTLCNRIAVETNLFIPVAPLKGIHVGKRQTLCTLRGPVLPVCRHSKSYCLLLVPVHTIRLHFLSLFFLSYLLSHLVLVCKFPKIFTTDDVRPPNAREENKHLISKVRAGPYRCYLLLLAGFGTVELDSFHVSVEHS